MIHKAVKSLDRPAGGVLTNSASPRQALAPAPEHPLLLAFADANVSR
jgi:hypothetical protein